jgi:hypothetical protein
MRTDVISGPAWLPRHPATTSRSEYSQGDWELVIERRQVIGRIGWQRVTETYRMPSSVTVLPAREG